MLHDFAYRRNFKRQNLKTREYCLPKLGKKEEMLIKQYKILVG
jgi:hypothetical protein